MFKSKFSWIGSQSNQLPARRIFTQTTFAALMFVLLLAGCGSEDSAPPPPVDVAPKSENQSVPGFLANTEIDTSPSNGSANSSGNSTKPDLATENRLLEVHNALVDLYFPPDPTIFGSGLDAHAQIRAGLWRYAESTPNILALLQPLASPQNLHALPPDIQSAFPDVIAKGFQNVPATMQEHFLNALRRHPVNELRKYAFLLRKVYALLSYSGPLTDQIAGVNTDPGKPNPVEFDYPKSRLKLDNGTITHEEGEIDYLIIGTGPAGSLIAHELARHKKNARVVILDSGSFIIPGTIKTESFSPLMESQNLRTNVQGGIAIRNGNAIGGGTAVNVDLAFSPLTPAIQHRIENWVENGWVNSSIFNMDKIESTYSWLTGLLGTRRVTEDEINENNKILWTTAKGSSYPSTYYLNASKPQSQDPAKEIVKHSAADVFLIPALEGGMTFKGNLNLIPDARVTRLLMQSPGNGQTISGVEIEFQQPLQEPANEKYVLKDPNHFDVKSGTKAILHAKNIILSAGTLGSAEILLRSGIKNDRIGKGIVMHPSLGIPAKFERKINPLEGLPASVFAVSEPISDGYFFEAMSAEPAFAALIHPGSGPQLLDVVRNFNHLGGFGIMLVDTPSDDNRVFIDPKTNKVEVSYEFSEPDLRRMKRALDNALHMLFNAGAKEVYLPTIEPVLSSSLDYQPLTSPDQIDQVVRNIKFFQNENFISSAHMQGSNKMGSSPENSVVSTNFRVWDQEHKSEIPNLYVVDSSVFPTSIGANPMQSIYTIAKLFIDNILTTVEERRENAPVDASASQIGTGVSWDSAPASTNPQGAPSTGNLHKIFSSPSLRHEFQNFLDYVLRQVDAKKFFTLVDKIGVTGASDKDFYIALSKNISKIRPWGFRTKKILAMNRQTKILTNQVKDIIKDGRQISGYAEIGFPGRHIADLKTLLKMNGPYYAINDEERATDFIQRFSIREISNGFRSPYEFVKLNDYAPISSEDIPSENVDLVTCFIGLHHISPEKLDPFIKSIYRILRPGGILILRDHDAKSDDLKALVSVAHSVFNVVATEETVEAEQAEYRNFQDINYWITKVEGNGFKAGTERLLQEGDPTLNTMVAFRKVESENEKRLKEVSQKLASEEGYKRELLQTYMTSPEWTNVDMSKEYSDFIEHTPFYEFPYFENIGIFWKVFGKSYKEARKKNSLSKVVTSEHFLMDLFIGTFMTVEYGVKGIVSTPVKFVYGESSGNKEPDTIKVLVDDAHDHVQALDSRIKVVQTFPNSTAKLLEIPRYKEFKDIIIKMALADVAVVEVAGNDEILIKVKLREDQGNPCIDEKHQRIEGCLEGFKWNISTDKSMYYAGITVKLKRLGDVIRHLTFNGVEISYIHDF